MPIRLKKLKLCCRGILKKWLLPNKASTSRINRLQYGQPFSPYEQGFDQDLDPDFSNIIVEMPQSEVMTNGYGQKITAKSFPVVNQFLRGRLKIDYGTYNFEELVLSSISVNEKDKRIKSNLYGFEGITDGNINPVDAAFIHGTVGFALMNGTRFVNSKLVRLVRAEIGALDDNWDFKSSTIPKRLNLLIQTLLGPDHDNLTAPIQIHFRGVGKYSTVESD